MENNLTRIKNSSVSVEIKCRNHGLMMMVLPVLQNKWGKSWITRDCCCCLWCCCCRTGRSGFYLDGETKIILVKNSSSCSTFFSLQSKDSSFVLCIIIMIILYLSHPKRRVGWQEEELVLTRRESARHPSWKSSRYLWVMDEGKERRDVRHGDLIPSPKVLWWTCSREGNYISMGKGFLRRR